jgi:hypothetical protein
MVFRQLIVDSAGCNYLLPTVLSTVQSIKLHTVQRTPSKELYEVMRFTKSVKWTTVCSRNIQFMLGWKTRNVINKSLLSIIVRWTPLIRCLNEEYQIATNVELATLPSTFHIDCYKPLLHINNHTSRSNQIFKY